MYIKHYLMNKMATQLQMYSPYFDQDAFRFVQLCDNLSLRAHGQDGSNMAASLRTHVRQFCRRSEVDFLDSHWPRQVTWCLV